MAYQSSSLDAQTYLEFERVALEKHEFIGGEIVAMAGASPCHVIVSSNLMVALGIRFKGSSCIPLGSDMRVASAVSGDYFYPDVTVACPPEFEEDNLLNPTVVFEVLSPSTERRDRGAKAAAYRQIPSLQQLVLVHQAFPMVEVYSRLPDGLWSSEVFTEMEAEFTLASIGVSLALSEVYERAFA